MSLKKVLRKIIRQKVLKSCDQAPILQDRFEDFRPMVPEIEELCRRYGTRKDFIVPEQPDNKYFEFEYHYGQWQFAYNEYCRTAEIWLVRHDQETGRTREKKLLCLRHSFPIGMSKALYDEKVFLDEPYLQLWLEEYRRIMISHRCAWVEIHT